MKQPYASRAWCVVGLLITGLVGLLPTLSPHSQTHTRHFPEANANRAVPVLPSNASIAHRVSEAKTVLSEETIARWLRAVRLRLDPPPDLPFGSGLALQTGWIRTNEGRCPNLTQPPGRTALTRRSTVPVLVQFKGPIRTDHRERLTRLGCVIRGYVPHHAFLIEGTPDVLTLLDRQSDVRWMGMFLPTYKVEPVLCLLPDLWTRQEGTVFDPATHVRVSVQTLDPTDVVPVSRHIQREDGRVLAVAPGRRWGLVRAELPWSALPSVAADPHVQWIEPWIEPRLVNDVAVRPGFLNVTNVWFIHGLTGSNQVIGHADTGLDVGDWATLHPDLRDRLQAVFALGRPGNWSDPHGHGTHTAGSILGQGVASDGQFRGVAFQAQLVHQSVLDSYGGLGGLPLDLNDLFEQAYIHGARIHSDSWGSRSFGRYTTSARQCDEFMWDHPDMLLVFAAGNDGTDADADGVVDPDSLAAPATAKNVLSVGAAESDRPPGSGGYSSYTWGGAWPSDYPASPIYSDYVSWPADGLHIGLAAFSSRGPTDDNRIKPDVVAPGVNIVSCRSLYPGAGTLWGTYSPNTSYAFSGGTSMATPLIAGAAALVREYLTTRGGIVQPSAALIKALLLSGARSLYPGQYGTDRAQEIPVATPNTVEGWGMVDVERTLFPAPPEYIVHDALSSPLQTGQTNQYVFLVTTGTPVTRVLVAWSDYPATPGAAIALVNDLDLAVRMPDGQVRWATPIGPDHTNNVEAIFLPSSANGICTTEVWGANVPYGPQPYALVIRGPVRVAPTVAHTPLENTFVTNAPYPVVAQVTCATPFDTNSVLLYWTLDGPSGPFTETVMTQRLDGAFAAELPAQTVGATFHYYIAAGTVPLVTTHPATAPSTLHAFSVTEPRVLTVAGSPSEWLTVTPPYGTHTIADGTWVNASAMAFSNLTPTTRIACAGWTGTGSVPASGTAAEVGFALLADSTLTWNWEQQYALVQTSSVLGIVNTTSWWSALATASTITAPSEARLGSVVYRFAGWWVDGARQPDSTSPAVNPATGLAMPWPRTAVADYRPEDEDTDGDGLSDWWELFYFGSLAADPDMDSDGDGFTNRLEYQDQTNPRDMANHPQAPSIAFVPLSDPYPAPAPWPIRAQIHDNGRIASVSVWWSLNGAPWQSAWLTDAAGTGEYHGDIPPPGENGDAVEYRIEAVDGARLKAVSGPYRFVARYPVARVGTLDAGPYRLRDGTSTNLSLVVSNAGLAMLTWSTSEHLLFDDMETDVAGWTHSGSLDVWHIQQDRFASASHAWHFGSGPGGTYPDRAHASLVSPVFALLEPARLSFRHWASMEYDMEQWDNHFWDGGIVELSTNGGASYFQIEPIGGYPHRITPNPDSPFPPETPCFGTTTGEWATVVFDLSAWTTLTARVRFRFGADGYVTDEGWYIDDVAITPRSGDVNWLIPSLEGSLAPGGVSNVPITLSVLPLALAETRSAVLVVSNNSPVRPSLTVHPLTLHNNSRALHVSYSERGLVVPSGRVLVDGDSSPSFAVVADPYCHAIALRTNEVLLVDWQPTPSTNWIWPHVTQNGTLRVEFDWIRTVYDTPLWWLAAFGLTNQPPEIEAVADPDGDGMLTWQEYRAGTVPTNAASVALYISDLKLLSGGSVALEWLSFTNRDYRYEVWVASNLRAGFTLEGTNLPATPPINAWTHSVSDDGPRFYRVRVLRP